MAPEQIAGKSVSVRSDLYSLGLVLYELFTGKQVFSAGSVAELARMQQETSPTSPSSYVDGFDPAVERDHPALPEQGADGAARLGTRDRRGASRWRSAGRCPGRGGNPVARTRRGRRGGREVCALRSPGRCLAAALAADGVRSSRSRR